MTVDEDTSVNGSITISDVDGDSVSATLDTPPASGSVVLNIDRTYTYTPDPNFTGSDSFVVLLDDGNGGTSTVSVSVTVNPVNDAPVALDDTQTTDEDTSIAGAVALSDIDGDIVTASLGTAPTNGTAVVNTDGTYTYTPNTNFNGTDTFTVSADDGNGGTDVATVTITVNAVTDAPTGTADDAITDEDTPVSGVVITDDIDGDTVTTSLDTAPTNGTVVVNTDGTYTYTPNADFNGMDSFIVLLDDGNGGTNTVTVSVIIDPVNDNPVAGDDSHVTDEDAPVAGAVSLTDVDGDTITASLGTTAPSNGSVVVNTDGTYIYTPNADFNGTDTFTISADDGNGGTDIATVTITVDPVNDAPTGTSANVTTDEDTSVNGAVASNDIDGDTVTASLDTPPASGVVSVNGDGTYTYTPNADFYGNDSFVVLLDDGNGGTSTVTTSVTINPINDDPVAVSYTHLRAHETL
ncbi:MAG: tandem-95 repeat protein, partial [Hyphomonas sp.]